MGGEGKEGVRWFVVVVVVGWVLAAGVFCMSLLGRWS